MLPLTLKYSPKRLSEIVGQSRAVQALRFKPAKPVIIYGPPGCGKTAAVHALANETNAELVELSASDYRNKQNIEDVLKPAAEQVSLFGSNKIILVDELEGLSGTKDRGAIPAIISVLKTAKFPIYFITNDPWESKFSALRKCCTLLQFDKLSTGLIAEHLGKICEKEGIKAEPIALKHLAAQADGDMRAALNDLQVISAGGEVSLKTLKLWGREQETDIPTALRMIFKSSAVSTALSAYDRMDEEPEQVIYWLDQNIPLEYTSSALREACDCVSLADRYRSRITHRQHWGFLVYIRALLSAGVQQAKSTVNPRQIIYQRPTILQNIFIRAAKRSKYKGIAEQVNTNLHASVNALQRDFIPFLKFIAEHDSEMSGEINDWLGLT